MKIWSPTSRVSSRLFSFLKTASGTQIGFESRDSAQAVEDVEVDQLLVRRGLDVPLRHLVQLDLLGADGVHDRREDLGGRRDVEDGLGIVRTARRFDAASAMPGTEAAARPPSPSAAAPTSWRLVCALSPEYSRSTASYANSSGFVLGVLGMWVLLRSAERAAVSPCRGFGTASPA